MRRLAVLGHPVGHSRSPAMHTEALKALAERGLEGKWTYDPIDVAPDELEDRVREMAAADFVGANVTIPHKEAALRLADTASPVARAIGAANTLSFAAGKIHADNTDAGGLIEALRGLPASPRGVRALVLGAGGAARASIWALAQAGGVVYVWNRTPSRARDVYDELGEQMRLGGAPVESPRQGDYGIVVNTTSVGLRGEDPFEHLPLHPRQFAGQVVVDMVYGDRPSKLIEVAEREGADVVDGIEILVRQGALSLEAWTGRKPPLDAMRAGARG